MNYLLSSARCLGLAALLLCIAAPAAAQEQKLTLREFFDGMLALSAKQCARRGELEKQYERDGKLAHAHAARTAETIICECTPSRMQRARASLSTQQLSLVVTESEFSARYLPGIVAPCTAQGLRSSYAQGCAERFAPARPNAAAYCACMSREVAKFTDLETMQLGRESADYMPLAAEAKKEGRPVPDKPPLLGRMFEFEAVCARE